jgi:hypothetical protein
LRLLLLQEATTCFDFDSFGLAAAVGQGRAVAAVEVVNVSGASRGASEVSYYVDFIVFLVVA